MRLSEQQIKATPTPIRRTTLSDGRGLELRMTPSGKRTWSLLYPFNGKKQRFTIGDYPAVKLKEARLIADKLRNQVAHGQNPQELRLPRLLRALLLACRSCFYARLFQSYRFAVLSIQDGLSLSGAGPSA